MVRHSSSLTAISATAGRFMPPNSSGTSSAQRPNSRHFARSGAASSGLRVGCSPRISRSIILGSSGISSLSTNRATRSCSWRCSSQSSADMVWPPGGGVRGTAGRGRSVFANRFKNEPEVSSSAVANSVPEPDSTTFEHLAAFQRYRAQRSCHLSPLATVKDAWCASHPVHRREYGPADLVDEAGTKEGAVRHTPAVHLQAFDAELAIQDVEHAPKIESALASEDVGNAILPQACEVRVGDGFGQYDDDRIATDIVTAPRDFAVSIEHDPISGRIAPGEPGFPRIALVGMTRIGVTLGVLLTGDAADEPGVDRKSLVQPLE